MAVKNIRADQIRSIEFDSLLYGLTELPSLEPVPNQPEPHPPFVVTVNEAQLIGRFLHALKYADEYPGANLMDERPSLSIEFYPLKGRQRRSLGLEFNNAAFGSMFQAVLNDLPSYEVRQMHRRVGALADRVREVDFYGVQVTDPEQVTRIVQDFQHVGKEAYTRFGYKDDTFGINLLLQNGDVERIVFVISSSAMQARKPPLPGTIWLYYKQVQQKTH